MDIYRITVNTEKADFCKVFTDYQQALTETDSFLNDNQLNDGCCLGSEEDFMALNSMLAERFDDLYNSENFAEWDNIGDGVIKHLDYLESFNQLPRSMQPGTIIQNTLRNQDIASACIEALYHVDKSAAEKFMLEHINLTVGLYDYYINHTDSPYWDEEDALLDVSEDLWELMDQYAPDGTTFGGRENAPTDFGYWPINNLDEE